jgi:hypothetical protein
MGLFIEREVNMCGHIYEPITPALFAEHLARPDEHVVYIAQKDMPTDFCRIVEVCAKASGELFANKVVIITEKLSPIAIEEIEKIAKQNRYSVVCDNPSHVLEYIGSEVWGHHATDYYHLLQYGRVRVTA